eukprot:TRINITY_DN998_c0_g1_i2.p1 TRINITY_DN998_c0_g1~~TRINITY_DN998_c0_g1_i2.p1  ORF type:complete len:184 (-),score=10.96 TRINITY_DN998_c0_g1_i2:508-1059(-)
MEQLTERISEKLTNAQIQPLQRPYHVGSQQTGTLDPSKRAFGVKTLEGNWFEEQADSSYHHGRAMLRSDTERLWQPEYAATVGGASTDKIHREDVFLHRASQHEHLALQAKSGRAFPGHQPEKDPAVRTTVALSGSRGMWETETAAAHGRLALVPRPEESRAKPSGRRRVAPVQDRVDATDGP